MAPLISGAGYMPPGPGIFSPGGFYDYFWGPSAQARRQSLDEYKNLGEYLRAYGTNTPQDLPQSTPALDVQSGKPIATPQTKLSAGGFGELIKMQGQQATTGKTIAETGEAGAKSKLYEATAGQTNEETKRLQADPAALAAFLEKQGYSPEEAAKISGMGSKNFAPYANYDLVKMGSLGTGKVSKPVDKDMAANHMQAHEGWKQNIFAGLDPKAAKDLNGRLARDKVLNGLEAKLRASYGTDTYDALEQAYQARVYELLAPPEAVTAPKVPKAITPQQQSGISAEKANMYGERGDLPRGLRSIAISDALNQMTPNQDYLRGLLGNPATPPQDLVQQLLQWMGYK